MLPEIRPNKETFEGLFSFIQTYYPSTEEEVGRVLHLAEEAGKKNKYYDAVGSLIARAGEKAEKKGITEVPAILEAIRFLEISKPESEKKLTPSKYVELLAKAENTSSNLAFWNNRLTHEEQVIEAAAHSEKATELYKFLLHGNALG